MRGTADDKLRIPSQIPFIIANEGCERFSFSVGSLWVLLANAGVRNATVTRAITETGLSVTAVQMCFFAAFAFATTWAFWRYARRYRLIEHYRA